MSYETTQFHAKEYDTKKVLARKQNLKRELLAAALSYAAKGWPIFPVKPGKGKKPYVKWGKGTDDAVDLYERRATTDPDTINAWWAKWPLAMIGVATGERSGIAVLDIDRKNGVDGLEALRVALGGNPYDLTPLVAETPSGGLHFYFRYSGPLKNSASMIAAGIDVRGDGGFIVAPPSHPNPDDLDLCEYSWGEAAHG